MRAVLAVLLAVGPATAAPIPKELKKVEDKVAIVGKWEVARSSRNGQELAAYSPAHALVFRPDGTLVFEYPDSKPQFADWTLDTTETPKRMDWRMHGSKYEFCHRYAFRDGRLLLARSNGLKAVPDDLFPVPGITVVEYVRADAK